mgnify:CR=1 FL=1
MRDINGVPFIIFISISVSLYKEISTINNSRYILIELPLTYKYIFLNETIEEIKKSVKRRIRKKLLLLFLLLYGQFRCCCHPLQP